MDSHDYMVVSSKGSTRVLYWNAVLGFGDKFVDHQTIEVRGGTDVEHFEMDAYHWIMISTSDSKRNVGYLKAFERLDEHVSPASHALRWIMISTSMVVAISALFALGSIFLRLRVRLAKASAGYDSVAQSEDWRENCPGEGGEASYASQLQS